MGLKVADRIISEENGFPEAMTEIRLLWRYGALPKNR